MSPNPLNALDSFLAEYLSAKNRRRVHSALALIGVLVGIWFAAHGDWTQVAVAIAATVYPAANRANTSHDDGPSTPDPSLGIPGDAEDYDPDNERSGGNGDEDE